jgi:hypothetical protein
MHEASELRAKIEIAGLISRYIASLTTDGDVALPPVVPPHIDSFHDRRVRIDLGWRFTERRGSLNFRTSG